MPQPLASAEIYEEVINLVDQDVHPVKDAEFLVYSLLIVQHPDNSDPVLGGPNPDAVTIAADISYPPLQAGNARFPFLIHDLSKYFLQATGSNGGSVVVRGLKVPAGAIAS